MQQKHQRQTTFMAKTQEHQPQWFLLDAEGKTLGRLASEITKILRGKHKPTYTPHADTGDGIIVINADKVVVTGNKEATKVYRHYTGFQSGLRETPYRVMKERKPTFILEHAVRKMMPKASRLARAQMKRLRLIAGTEHGMEAQQPVEVQI